MIRFLASTRAAVSARWSLFVFTARTAPRITSAACVWSVVRGLIPVSAAYLVSRLADLLGGGVTFIVLFAALVVVEQVSVPVGEWIESLVEIDIDRAIAWRVVDAVDRADLVSDLERADVAHDLTLARAEQGAKPVGFAARKLLSGIDRLVTLAACVMVLLRLVGGTAALVLFAALAYRQARSHADAIQAREVAAGVSDLRRSAYLRSTLFDLRAARDLVFYRGYDLVRAQLLRSSAAYTSRVERALPRRVRLVRTAAGLALIGTIVWMMLTLTAAFRDRHIGGSDYLFGVQCVLLLSAMLPAGGRGVQFAQAQLAARAVSSLERRFADNRSEHGHVGGVPTPSRRGDRLISVAGLRYRYDGADHDALRDVDVVIDPGALVGLVGANGAGKTTLLRLLAGHYSPTSGDLRVAGVPLDRHARRAWQREVVFVPHASQHLPGSLVDNLTWGDRDIADKAIEYLAMLGGAHLVTSTARSAGLAFIGDSVTFSTGEWQRVALARSLARLRYGSRLLIWDEPTSALDAEGEAHAIDVLRTSRGSAAALVVSHRVPLLVHCDHVLVLEDGQISESGPPMQLLAESTRFAQLYEEQSAGYRIA